jgi:hypothetical protein
MYDHEYTSTRCSAPDSSSYFGSYPDQPAWSFDPIPAEPHPSTSVDCPPYCSAPLHSVNDPYVPSQSLDLTSFRSLGHTESMCSGRDWAFGTPSEGDQPGLETLSFQPAHSLVPSPSYWSSEFSNETIYSDYRVAGHSGLRVELPLWELRHSEFAIDPSFDTRSYNLPTNDSTDDVAYNKMVGLGESNESRCHYDWTEERDDPKRLKVTGTSSELSTSHTQHSTKPYICPLAECNSRFLHHSDLCRHQKTVHMRRESGLGYRCAFEGCPKTDKIWTRLDSFKQHILRRHQSADVHNIITQSTRSRSGADASFPFAVATPTTMSRGRRGMR